MVADDSCQTSYIRQRAKKGEIAISDHALENMSSRKSEYIESQKRWRRKK